MTQEDKELLLRDLCARMLYGVKLQLIGLPNSIIHDKGIRTLVSVLPSRSAIEYDMLGSNVEVIIDLVKPYLRPISSMTEEEAEGYFSIQTGSIRGDMIAKIDFYIKHHFDFRLTPEGLSMIEADLALEAPEGMYNIKKK